MPKLTITPFFFPQKNLENVKYKINPINSYWDISVLINFNQNMTDALKSEALCIYHYQGLTS